MLPVTAGVRALGWMSHSACQHADPELFFPVATLTAPAARQIEAAKAVCGPCAVRPICLSYALATMPEGIWGGMTLDERRAARRRPPRHQASAQSGATVTVLMTTEGATWTGQPVPPDWTA